MQDTARINGDLDRQLNQYGEWRASLASALESYRDWCEAHNKLDSDQELKLLQLVEELRSNALTIALVGEFSRGKTELINAIFFSDYDRRLLPSTPGRTTMCPTEILYDDKSPPCIRLLPIESRKSPLTISELKKRAINWTTLPLKLGSPGAMANTLGEILKSKRIDKHQASKLGLGALATELQREDGQVEVPVWRHAIINYPHYLLKQGLVVLDTPGLNALGAEPELTLGTLPNAHAILFVLSADTGVTRTDMEIWTNHVCPATSSDPDSRIAALNKIDTLWDELESPKITQGFIERQIRETHKLLGIDPGRVFPVSAQKGLIGKVRGSAELVERSGLPALEYTLSTIAIQNRQNMISAKIADEIGQVVRRSRGLIQARLESLLTEFKEIVDLENKSTEVIDGTATRLREQKKIYDQEVQSFDVTRRLLSNQVKKMVGVLSISRFDELIAKTRYSMRNSWTTPGLRRGMQTFFGGTLADLKKVDAQSEEICKLVEQIYDRFHGEFGLAIPRPDRFSTQISMEQYGNLYEEAEAFRTSAAMVITEQHFVVKKFFIVLVSRARLIFEECNGATRDWAKGVLTPIYNKIKGHKTLIDRRLENLESLRYNMDSLQKRKLVIHTELKSLHVQARYIDGILSAIRKPKES